jgi:hypothetical protein
MPGPLPKPIGRGRAKSGPGARKLRQVEAPAAPKLPFQVSKPTSDWWSAIWSSPMAAEWEPSDVHGLFMLADLMDAYWCAPDAGTKAKLSTEIRLQSQRYGLSPIDRRRLQWEIAQPKAAEIGYRARQSKPPKADPRLKAIK